MDPLSRSDARPSGAMKPRVRSATAMSGRADGARGEFETEHRQEKRKDQPSKIDIAIARR